MGSGLSADKKNQQKSKVNFFEWLHTSVARTVVNIEKRIVSPVNYGFVIVSVCFWRINLNLYKHGSYYKYQIFWLNCMLTLVRHLCICDYHGSTINTLVNLWLL